MAKSILQKDKECYLCRRFYNLRTVRGLEEHHIPVRPRTARAERAIRPESVVVPHAPQRGPAWRTF